MNRLTYRAYGEKGLRAMKNNWESYYTGIGYPTVDEITSEAKKNGFTYYYWASEYGYHGFYNGDTVIVYNRVEDLPMEYQPDAEDYGSPIN